MYSITNNFGLSYSIVFVRNQEIVIITKGVTHVKTSMNYGHKMQGQHSQNVHFRKIGKEDIDNLDFIALVSKYVCKQGRRRIPQFSSNQSLKLTPTLIITLTKKIIGMDTTPVMANNAIRHNNKKRTKNIRINKITIKHS